MEYYEDMEKKRLKQYTTVWMKLTDIMLNKKALWKVHIVSVNLYEILDGQNLSMVMKIRIVVTFAGEIVTRMPRGYLQGGGD